jgi:parallel beta-helix repeat protein
MTLGKLGKLSAGLHKWGLAVILGLTSLTLIQMPPCDAQTTVTLRPGADIQAAVDANPVGTAFILTAGVYREQSIIPKSGDSFTGQPGAVLNGSQVLTNWIHNGSYWTNNGAPALSTPYGDPSLYCADHTTGCVYPQDLYFDNKPLVHKLALPISSGQWYFDYKSDVVYIADDPSGHTVELGVTPQAFHGYANNVTVQNLTIEKYATTLNSGAVSPYGQDWTIKSNEVRLNHAAGIKPQYNKDNFETIINNYVHDNGQEGIAVGGGTGTLVEYNTISSNDYAFVLSESGGGKIAATTNARVMNNKYINNNSVGLWGDSGATGTVFSGNTIQGSQLDGIRYEISHSGTITNNTLIDNAQYQGTGACSTNAREIVLSESDTTNVSGNKITTNCGGIAITEGTRQLAFDDSISNNSFSYSGNVTLPNRIGGFDAPPGTSYAGAIYDPANKDTFDNNAYHFVSRSMLNLNNWIWKGPNGRMSPLNWAEWKAAGLDAHGTAD